MVGLWLDMHKLAGKMTTSKQIYEGVENESLLQNRQTQKQFNHHHERGEMKMHHTDYNAWQALQTKPTIYKARKKPPEKHVTIVPVISIIFTAAVLFILCL